jgi:hypothetical protein
MATGQAAGIAADLCKKAGIRPRDLDGKLVRQEMIADGVPLDKVPDGYWAFLAEASKDDVEKYSFVRMRGDMVGVRLPDGSITMRFGSVPKPKPEATVDKPENMDPDIIF